MTFPHLLALAGANLHPIRNWTKCKHAHSKQIKFYLSTIESILLQIAVTVLPNLNCSGFCFKKMQKIVHLALHCVNQECTNSLFSNRVKAHVKEKTIT